MNAFLKQINNLAYVKIDRKRALNHWNTCIDGMGTTFWECNHKPMAHMKAAAGILGHRHNSKFRWHVLKEKVLNRRLQGKRL